MMMKMKKMNIDVSKRGTSVLLFYNSWAIVGKNDINLAYIYKFGLYFDKK